jgi:hypothetical protein
VPSGQTTVVFTEQVITTVSCGTGSTLSPFGTLPPVASSRPALPVTLSRWSVVVGPALFTHTTVVFVFLFLPVPVVLVTLTGLKRT